MKVLSLFDGISVAQYALTQLGYYADYYASEIDKYAISITQKNFPGTTQIGDVTKIGIEFPYPTIIDLVIFGSPCQDLSIAKKDRQGLKGSRSGLFYEAVRILKEIKPKYFLMENVNSMSKESKETISTTLYEATGYSNNLLQNQIEPIMINASLVSAQNRKRLFWTNIQGITQPKDKEIYLKDILENGETDNLKSYCIDANYYKGSSWEHSNKKSVRQMIRIGQLSKGSQGDRIYSTEGKSVSLSANSGGHGNKTGLYLASESIRKLTPIECERLQCLPDNYTEFGFESDKEIRVSNTQRYKCLGNAFNAEVIKHILSFMKGLQ